MGDCFSKFALEGQQEENHEVEFWIQEVHPERKTRATRERYPDLLGSQALPEAVVWGGVVSPPDAPILGLSQH